MADEPTPAKTDEDELLLTEPLDPENPAEPGPDDEGEEEVPAFGDDTPSPDVESPTIRHMRAELSKAHRRIAEMERTIAPKEEPLPTDLGPEPALEDFDFDADKFTAAVKERARQEARIAAKAAQPVADPDEAAAQVAATRERIEEEKAALKKPDVEDAFDLVRGTLSEVQQSLLVATVDKGNTAKLIYALAKNPERLLALAAQNDIPRFIKDVAKLEGQLKMVKRTPPNPDEPERGSGRLSRESADKTLEKLEAEADRTLDRSKVIAYKRKLRETQK